VGCDAIFLKKADCEDVFDQFQFNSARDHNNNNKRETKRKRQNGTSDLNKTYAHIVDGLNLKTYAGSERRLVIAYRG
jgi:hypothetical protein